MAGMMPLDPDKVRAALGRSIHPAAREPFWTWANSQTRQHYPISLRYEWVTDWAPLDGIDFIDGEEWITLLPLKGTDQ